MSYAIIDRSSCSYYTYLSHVFACLDDAQRRYNWLIADWECCPKDEAIQKLLERDYLWMSGDELTALVEWEDFQWIWGILCGFGGGKSLCGFAVGKPRAGFGSI